MLDANIILSALMKNGITRKILLSKEIEFYTIQYTLEEVLKYNALIKRKSGLNDHELTIILDTIFENIKIIPIKNVKSNFKKAFEVMKNIDPKDAPILAGAMSIPNDGLWTNDEHLKQQKLNKTIGTKELLSIISVG